MILSLLECRAVQDIKSKLGSAPCAFTTNNIIIQKPRRGNFHPRYLAHKGVTGDATQLTDRRCNLECMKGDCSASFDQESQVRDE